MDMKEYQRLAATTDQNGADDPNGMMVALLGLAGETGSLLTLYKKWLRDGDAYQIMKERVAEELGDVLWYVADIATRAGIDLDDVATGNQKGWSPLVALLDGDPFRRGELRVGAFAEKVCRGIPKLWRAQQTKIRGLY
jgi:NTP pyrophosphatase (non-canonical NTP hydrolase)